MKLSIRIALAVGFFVGLGIQVALAQPVDWLNPRFRNATITNLLTVKSLTTTGGTVNLGGTINLNNSLSCTGGSTIGSCGSFSTATGTGGYVAATTSGNNAFGVSTNGARIDFGAGASDYASSDGTTVTFAGPLSSSSYISSQVGISAGGTYQLASVAMQRTAPTVTACSGGTAASITSSNGTAAFVFDVGTACAGESTAVITFPAATTGWLCSCSSTTADRVLQQKVIPAANTTTVTIQNIVMSTGANGDFTDGADVGCICMGN